MSRLGSLSKLDDQQTRMLAAGGLHQEVQVLEVVVVLGEQDQAVLDRVREMARISCAAEIDISRDDNLVTGSPQQVDKRRLGAVVVQVEIHASGPGASGA
jgi:hypothetical protein